jgi:hypothetical protein
MVIPFLGWGGMQGFAFLQHYHMPPVAGRAFEEGFILGEYDDLVLGGKELKDFKNLGLSKTIQVHQGVIQE